MGSATPIESNEPPSIENYNPKHLADTEPPVSCDKVDVGMVNDTKGFYKQVRSGLLSLQSLMLTDHPEKAQIEAYATEYPGILKELEAKIDRYNLCLFQSQLKESITKNIKNNDNTAFLQQLQNIGTCFESSKDDRSSLKDLYMPVFDSIYNFFANKKNLTKEDCEVLRRTYEAWAGFNEGENDLQASKDDAIPFYNVNPHNSAFPYWLRERERGNIPVEGLPLLHVDTHTDLGHVHTNGAGWSDKLDLNQLGKLMVINDNEQFKNEIRRLLVGQEGVVEAEVEALLDQEAVQLRLQIYGQMRERVHHIAQPVVAGLATDVASSLVMALPPWSPRLPRSEYKDGQVDPFKVQLYKDSKGKEYALASEDTTLTQTPGTPIHKLPSGAQVQREFGMTVMDSNLEQKITDVDENGKENSSIIVTREMTESANYANYMPKDQKKFILDIDLDAFVSEGKSGDLIQPVSYGRHQQNYGGHDGHDNSNETDPAVEVTLNEFELIEGRLDFFFDQLRDMKAKGHEPAIITIADSTILQSMAGNADDSLSGGNFTPSCLVFLLNYRMREELKTIYSLDIK